MYSRSTLIESSKKRYAEKLKIVGIAECPYTVPTELWKNNPAYKPNLEHPEVYQCLIESPGNFTRKSMANRKSLKAYNLFISGWVRTIYHLDISDNKNIVMKADVIPSQRVHATPQVPWVALSKKQGTVLFAHCSMLMHGGFRRNVQPCRRSSVQNRSSRSYRI